MNNCRQHLLWPLSPNVGRKAGRGCYLFSSWNALRPGTGLHPPSLVVMSLAFHFHCYSVGYLGSGLTGPPDLGNEQLEQQTPECAQQQQAGNSDSIDCASSHIHCSSYHLSLHALDSSVMQKGILTQARSRYYHTWSTFYLHRTRSLSAALGTSSPALFSGRHLAATGSSPDGGLSNPSSRR